MRGLRSERGGGLTYPSPPPPALRPLGWAERSGFEDWEVFGTLLGLCDVFVGQEGRACGDERAGLEVATLRCIRQLRRDEDVGGREMFNSSVAVSLCSCVKSNIYSILSLHSCCEKIIANYVKDESRNRFLGTTDQVQSYRPIREYHNHFHQEDPTLIFTQQAVHASLPPTSPRSNKRILPPKSPCRHHSQTQAPNSPPPPKSPNPPQTSPLLQPHSPRPPSPFPLSLPLSPHLSK